MYGVVVPPTISRIISLFYRIKVWDRYDGICICSTVLKLLQAINFVSFVLSCIIGAAITPHMQEVVLLTDLSILTSTHTVRMIYIMWRKAEILQFINEIGTHCTDDQEEFVRVSGTMSAFCKFADIFVFACSGEVILVVIFPIFTNASLVNIAFPWEKSGLTFWISHIFVSIGSVYSVIWFLLTVIIWYLLLSCSFKYQLLGNQLQNLGKTNTNACSTKQQQQQLCVERLITAIKTHRKIHGAIEHFSSTFSIFFFIQIMTSSIVICSGVYQLAFNSHENLFEDIFNCVFLMYNLFDILVLMYLGNEIKLSSDRLSYCLYESNWIEQSPTIKKYVVIMTEGLKRPQELIIGKLYPLNLQTFMSIVNGAYSMFNILRK